MADRSDGDIRGEPLDYASPPRRQSDAYVRRESGDSKVLRNIAIAGVALTLGGMFELVTLPDAFGGMLLFIGLMLTVAAFAGQKYALMKRRATTRKKLMLESAVPMTTAAAPPPATTARGEPTPESAPRATRGRGVVFDILIGALAIVAMLVLTLLAWSIPFRSAGTPAVGGMIWLALAICAVGGPLIAYATWRVLRRGRTPPATYGGADAGAGADTDVGAGAGVGADSDSGVGAAADDSAAVAGQFIIGVLLAGGMTFALIVFELIYAQTHGFRLSISQKAAAWTMVVSALSGLIAWSAWRGRIAGERGYLAGVLAGLALGALLVAFFGGMFGMVS